MVLQPCASAADELISSRTVRVAAAMPFFRLCASGAGTVGEVVFIPLLKQ